MFSQEKITKDLSRAKKFFEDIISFTVGPYTLDEMIKNKLDKINIIDVRDYDDYIEEHIPYAIHIPYKEMDEHLKMLDKDKTSIIYTYSDSCPRAYKSALQLLDEHYPTVVLRGGFKEWKHFDFDIIKSSSEDYDNGDSNA